MKKIILPALLIISSTSFAGPFAVTQDPDQYDGNADSKILATAVQPGFGDNYGSSFLFRTGVVQSASVEQSGSIDAYGSTLQDIGHPLDW